MSDTTKRFWVCTMADGNKEVVWNWEWNMHIGLYPEYVRFEGPHTTRERAEYAAGINKVAPKESQ